MVTPIQTRFFTEDYSIDRDRSTVLLPDDATSGWLLSSPCTTTFSKMHLTKTRQDSISPRSHSPSRMRDREFERRTIACRQTSKELQHRFSISSDISNPGLTTDDPFASTSPNSDTSFEDIYNHNPPPLNREAEEQLWGQYFEDPSSPIKGSLLDGPLYHDFRSILSSYAPTEVRFPSRSRTPISPDTFSPYPGDLHRSDAVCSSRDRSRTVANPRALPQYTAFPLPQAPEIPHPAHQSWPQRNESRTQQTSRPRAKTAPSQPRALAKPPSPLNVCTIVNNDIQYMTSTSHLHRSVPPTPMVLPNTGLVEQFVSHFDEDDDEEHWFGWGSLTSRLHISSRRGSSNASNNGSWSKKSSSGSEKRKKGRSLSELRDALKSCFNGKGK